MSRNVIKEAELPKGITLTRDSFTPFSYPEAFDFYQKQESATWGPGDIKYTTDVSQWNSGAVGEDIQRVVGGVLRGFVQTELVVGEYWSQKVAAWFPIPEVALMCGSFSRMEGIHAISYNQLSDTLNLNTYAAFKADAVASSKIDYLITTPNETLFERARSLAVFSAFTEGVVLFSSFSILQWLKTVRLLPGITSVIDYSVRDESIHSEAGCWLFRTLIAENQQLAESKQLWASILEAAKAVIELEHNFIDSVFQETSFPKLNPTDLKAFIVMRTNQKLAELGSADKVPFNKDAAMRIASWFELYNQSHGVKDGFAGRPSTYTQGVFKVNSAALSFD